MIHLSYLDHSFNSCCNKTHSWKNKILFISYTCGVSFCIFLTYSFLLPLKSLTVESSLCNLCYVGGRCAVPLTFSLDSCFPSCNFRLSVRQCLSFVSLVSVVFIMFIFDPPHTRFPFYEILIVGQN